VRLGLLLILACTPRETVVMPEPPIDPSIASLVIVFEGETPFVYAIDLADRSTPLLAFEATGWVESTFDAVAFGYPRPLAFYGLSAGQLRLVEEERSCGLTSPMTAAFFDRDNNTWWVLDPPSHESLDRIVDESMYGCTQVNLCRSFQAEIVELPTPDNVHFMLPIDAETTLIGTRTRRFFEITREGGLTEREDLMGLPSDAGMITPEGEIWVGGGGAIAHGPPSGPFTVLEVPNSQDQNIAAIAVREEEILVVGIIDLTDIETSTVVIHRYDGSAWSVVDRRLERAAAFRQCTIEWIGDDAVIVFGGITGLVWNGTRLTPFMLDSPIPLFEPHLNDIATRADFGSVMATNDGYLYQHGDAGPTDWIPIQEATLGNGIKGVAPAFEGFIYGGPDGAMNQYYPSSSPCTTERLAISDADVILQVGDAVLVSGGNPDIEMNNTVTWLYE
jgi:hypothetical protein